MRDEAVHGWDVRISSYRLADCFYATVEGLDAGARFARGSGATREEAERRALARATERLAATRRRG